MDITLGRISAVLAEPVSSREAELVEAINANIHPPTEVGEKDVYIRAMYIASDQVNSFGGRFPSEELSALVPLMIDSPVMVGHRKDKLPIGRNFYAEVVEREGSLWLKSYFYWLRSSGGAENLRENIDGGIYKECSIGFSFHLPECSICGKDIRTCQHQPMRSYDIGGQKVSCHFNYRNLERVLETSLVYRGAVPDTSVSKDLIQPETVCCGAPKRIESLSELDVHGKYLVFPFYESVPVTATIVAGRTELTRLDDGGKIDQSTVDRIVHRAIPPGEQLLGQLVGYRGKERSSLTQLEKYLAHRKGSVTRIELKLYPSPSLNRASVESLSGKKEAGVIPHQFIDFAGLPGVIDRLATKDGVLIFAATSLPPSSDGFHYRTIPQQKRSSGRWSLTQRGEETFFSGSESLRFRIHRLNLARLLKGGRFLAEREQRQSVKMSDNSGRRLTGELLEVERQAESLRLKLSGDLAGEFNIQPVKINGERRWLFYRSKCHSTGPS